MKRVGAGIVLFFLALALLAPWLAPYNPSDYSGEPLERPSPAHPLGTNDVGQDILSELIYGARISLVVGVVGGGLTMLIACTVGLAAGYLGGKTDFTLMRITDILMAIPHLPLMMLVAVYAGPSLVNLILIIALLGWMVPSRIIRSQALSLRSRTHVQAARLFGGGSAYVIGRHLAPALAPIIAAAFITQVGRAIAMEAGLAFLGLGDPTAKSWGMMIRYALNYRGIYFTPHWLWWLVPAGLCISLLVLGFTLFGAGLEESLDPRLRRRSHRAPVAVRPLPVTEGADGS